jgi:hypothetical protein
MQRAANLTEREKNFRRLFFFFWRGQFFALDPDQSTENNSYQNIYSKSGRWMQLGRVARFFWYNIQKRWIIPNQTTTKYTKWLLNIPVALKYANWP